MGSLAKNDWTLPFQLMVILQKGTNLFYIKNLSDPYLVLIFYFLSTFSFIINENTDKDRIVVVNNQ